MISSAAVAIACGGATYEGDDGSAGAAGSGASTGTGGSGAGGTGATAGAGGTGATAGAGGTGATAGAGGTGATAGAGGTGATAGAGGTGATAGAGGTGAVGGSGGTGGVPAQCQVSGTPGPGPHETKFVFRTDSTDPVYIYAGCRLRYDVLSCADGYNQSLAMFADCTTPCSDTSGGCIACGACFEEARAVTSSTPTEDIWPGNTYTFGTDPQGCSCHRGFTAPAGKYRVSVPVYLSESDALSGGPSVATIVDVDFDLPAPNGVVVVDLPAFASPLDP